MKFSIKEITIFILIIIITIIISIVIFKITDYIKPEIQKKLELEKKSIKLENKLKELIKKDIEFNYRIISNKKINNSINIIKERLLNNITDNPYDVEIYVIDSSMVNAVAFPGGLIIVYSGLLKTSENPEQVASVIAHELGHVVNRDAMNALIVKFSIYMITSIINRGDQKMIENIIKNLVNNTYSREIEKRTDIFACDLLIKSDIDPIHFSNFFKIIKEKQSTILDDSIFKYIGTHPDIDSRIEYAKQRSQEDFKGKKEKKIDIDWEKFKKNLPSIFD